MGNKRVHEIEGAAFSTIEEFYDEVSRKVIPGTHWGRNLDALNDILRGGFGTPDEGFVLRWKNSALSRQRLSYLETIRLLEIHLQRCDPTNRLAVAEDLERAKAGVGPTVFDWLVEIIQIHCEGGRESGDRVELELR
jgi:RNAse (barnase) inhibitor barstar